jgi:hypothetical protein
MHEPQNALIIRPDFNEFARKILYQTDRAALTSVSGGCLTVGREPNNRISSGTKLTVIPVNFLSKLRRAINLRRSFIKGNYSLKLIVWE